MEAWRTASLTSCRTSSSMLSMAAEPTISMMPAPVLTEGSRGTVMLDHVLSGDKNILNIFSAWNWCNKLDKKHYYSIFKLAGFTGFDGSFKN